MLPVTPAVARALEAGRGFALAEASALGLRLGDLEATLYRSRPPVPRLEERLDLPEPTEQVDVARILDVGANRTREALRIIEDYCRFVLDDAFLSGQCKSLRHDFTQA